MPYRFIVTLSDDERAKLDAFAKRINKSQAQAVRALINATAPAVVKAHPTEGLAIPVGPRVEAPGSRLKATVKRQAGDRS